MTYADPFDDPAFDPEGDPADYAAHAGIDLRWFVAATFEPAEVDQATQDDDAARWLAEQDALFASLALRALDDEVLSW